MCMALVVNIDVRMTVLLLFGRPTENLLLVPGHVCLDVVVGLVAWTRPRGFSFSRS